MFQRDLPDVDVAKSHIAMPHHHHLAHPSVWSNY
jgi:hypothetical protein